MIFNFSTICVSALALLSIVSAGPIDERKNKSCKTHDNAYPVLAYNGDAEVAGWFLGIGKNGVPVLTTEQTGVVDITLTDGSLGWFDGSSCKEKFLNYGKKEGLFGTQSLVFGSKPKVFNWDVELAQYIWNTEFESPTFQVCKQGDEWVVSLAAENPVDDNPCYLTELIPLGN